MYNVTTPQFPESSPAADVAWLPEDDFIHH
jgi:hypothetical protein